MRNGNSTGKCKNILKLFQEIFHTIFAKKMWIKMLAFFVFDLTVLKYVKYKLWFFHLKIFLVCENRIFQSKIRISTIFFKEYVQKLAIKTAVIFFYVIFKKKLNTEYVSSN